MLAAAEQLTLAQWGTVGQRAQLLQRSPLEVQMQWRNAVRPSLKQVGLEH